MIYFFPLKGRISFDFLSFFFILGLYFSSLALSSCEVKNKPIPSPISLRLAPTDTLKIPIKNFRDFKGKANTLFEVEDSVFILQYSEKSHSLLFVNINYPACRTIPLEREGPEGIPPIERISFHTSDSIFLQTEKRIYLIDSQGKIKTAWYLEHVQNNSFPDYGWSFAAYVFSSKLKWEPASKCLIVPLRPFVNPFKAEYYQFPLVHRLQLDEKKFYTSGVCYPEIYLKEIYHPIEDYTACFSEESLVVGFVADHFLYEYDLQNFQLKQKIPAKSKFTPEKIPSLSSQKDDVKSWIKYLNETPQYGDLHYDSFHKVYFRRIHHGSLDWKQLDKAVPFSIMVFDEHFRLMDEAYFPPNHYFDLNYIYFTSSLGLIMGMNTPNNPLNSDDELILCVFSLK